MMRPGRSTLPDLSRKSLYVFMPNLAHVLSLLALGSRVVDCVYFVFEHDGPDGIAAEAESGTADNDNGYGRAW